MGVLHWFVFVGFGFLFLTLVTAFGQLFDATFALPVVGHWLVYDWATELHHLAAGAVDPRVDRHPADPPAGGRPGPLQPVLRVTDVAGLLRRGRDPRGRALHPGAARLLSTLSSRRLAASHYPLTFFIGELFDGASDSALRNTIYLVAMVKIIISFTWMIVLARNTTMGVAWHRFTAWPNIWFRSATPTGVRRSAASSR